MNKINVKTARGGWVAIEAPEGKSMAVDASLLAHGVLSIGEYGPSGVKIAVFKEWDAASFNPDGYKIEGL